MADRDGRLRGSAGRRSERAVAMTGFAGNVHVRIGKYDDGFFAPPGIAPAYRLPRLAVKYISLPESSQRNEPARNFRMIQIGSRQLAAVHHVHYALGQSICSNNSNARFIVSGTRSDPFNNMYFPLRLPKAKTKKGLIAGKLKAGDAATTHIGWRSSFSQGQAPRLPGCSLTS